MTTDSSAIGNEKFISLTTRKRSGDLVATPVWIVALDDGALGFTTELGSGKVKRIRNFPEVTIQPSNARGVAKPDSTPVTARATVLTGADADPVDAAVRAKYGLQVSLIGAVNSVRRIVTRGSEQTRAAVRLELD